MNYDAEPSKQPPASMGYVLLHGVVTSAALCAALLFLLWVGT